MIISSIEATLRAAMCWTRSRASGVCPAPPCSCTQLLSVASGPRRSWPRTARKVSLDSSILAE